MQRNELFIYTYIDNILFCLRLMHTNWGCRILGTLFKDSMNYQRWLTHGCNCVPVSSILFVVVCVCVFVCMYVWVVCEGPKVTSPLPSTFDPGQRSHIESPTLLSSLLSLQVGQPGQRVALTGSFQRLETITTFSEPWSFSGLVNVIRRKLPSDTSSFHHIIWP